MSARPSFRLPVATGCALHRTEVSVGGRFVTGRLSVRLRLLTSRKAVSGGRRTSWTGPGRPARHQGRHPVLRCHLRGASGREPVHMDGARDTRGQTQVPPLRPAPGTGASPGW